MRAHHVETVIHLLPHVTIHLKSGLNNIISINIYTTVLETLVIFIETWHKSLLMWFLEFMRKCEVECNLLIY